jgi:hypothetical protein
MNTPHSKYRHVFAIIRWDPDMAAVEHQVTVTKIVQTEQIAEAEVQRLNALNSAKGCRYFAQLTRLMTDEPAGAEEI